jgi:hypothetical protein
MPDEIPTTASSADRFAAIMWGYFIEGCSIDGADLQEAIEKSGLGERRPAMAKDIEGKWDGEIEVGDELTFLTPDGKACVNRGAKDVQNV